MATKYAGQNALNKLMQLVKTALATKADKTNATASAAGLMSATDKTKLDGIAAGATKVMVDAALSAASTNPVQNKAVKGALDGKADKTNATTSAAGLMSAADKVKLDGVEGGATKTIVDDAMSSTSTNPVQNKVVKAALDGKLDVTGGTILGGLKVKTNAAGTGNIDVEGEIRASGMARVMTVYATNTVRSELMVDTPLLNLKPSSSEKSVQVQQDGDTAVKMECFDGTLSKGYARLEIGTPTGDNDAATKAYVDSKVASGGVTVDAEMSSTSTNPVQNKAVKSYVDTKVSGLQTADQVQDAIKNAITGVYTPKGSIAFASLPTPAAGNKGWVYNVSDAFTTTAAFVEGAGHSYGAGTNVVCVDVGSGSYKWDVLAGTIDLTELTADEVQTLWDSI